MSLALDPATPGARYSVKLSCGCRRRMTLAALNAERSPSGMLCERHWGQRHTVLSATMYVDQGVLTKARQAGGRREHVFEALVGLDRWASAADIAEALPYGHRLSGSTVREHLRRLHAAGRVSRSWMGRRTLWIDARETQGRSDAGGGDGEGAGDADGRRRSAW